MFLNAPVNSSRYTHTHIYICVCVCVYTLYIFIVSKLSHHWFITACRLSGSKLLSIIWTKLAYYHGYWSWELILMTFESKYENFHSGNCICKRCLQNGGHFVFPSLCSRLVCVWWPDELHSPSASSASEYFRHRRAIAGVLKMRKRIGLKIKSVLRTLNLHM